MEPLQVTWTLNRPMICNDYPIHLDSLVAWALVEEAKENDVEDPFAVIDDLPLGKSKDNVWQASILIGNNISNMQVFPMTKPHNLYLEDEGIHFLLGNKKQFKPGEGKFKGFDLRFNQQWRDHVTGWCIGDKERLTPLLSRITNIGKISRNNFGSVAAFEIKSHDKAQELWKLRTLPLALDKPLLPGYARAMRVCRPPYWNKTAFEPCQVPIDPDEVAAAKLQ